MIISASFDVTIPRKFVLKDILSSSLNVSSDNNLMTNSRRLLKSTEEKRLNIMSLSVESLKISETMFKWTASFVVAVSHLADTGFMTKEAWAASVGSTLTSDAFTAVAVLAFGDPFFVVTNVALSAFTASPTPLPSPSPTPISSAANLLFPIASEAVVTVVGAAVAASVAARLIEVLFHLSSYRIWKN